MCIGRFVRVLCFLLLPVHDLGRAAGLLRDVESMLRFAMLAEETSASKYREFASLATSPGAREALERIASEEDRHLSELRTQG